MWWGGCEAQITVSFHLQQKRTSLPPSAAPWLPVASVRDLNLSLPGGADGPGHPPCPPPQWTGVGQPCLGRAPPGLHTSLRGALLQPLKNTAGCPCPPLHVITRQRGPNPEALLGAAGDTGLLPGGGSVVLDVAQRGLGFPAPPPVTFTWWGLDPENAGSPKHSVRDGTLGVQSPRQAHTSCVSPAIRLDGGCLIRKMEFGVERTAPHVRRDPVLFFPDIAAISPKENHTRGPSVFTLAVEPTACLLGAAQAAGHQGQRRAGRKRSREGGILGPGDAEQMFWVMQHTHKGRGWFLELLSWVLCIQHLTEDTHAHGHFLWPGALDRYPRPPVLGMWLGGWGRQLSACRHGDGPHRDLFLTPATGGGRTQDLVGSGGEAGPGSKTSVRPYQEPLA